MSVLNVLHKDCIHSAELVLTDSVSWIAYNAQVFIHAYIWTECRTTISTIRKHDPGINSTAACILPLLIRYQRTHDIDDPQSEFKAEGSPEQPE